MTATRCKLADPRVCLGRADVGSSCVFCERQRARDAFRSGVMSFDQFRAVLAETNERAS